MQLSYGSENIAMIGAQNAAQVNMRDSVITNSATFYMTNSTESFSDKMDELSKLDVGAPVREHLRDYMSPTMETLLFNSDVLQNQNGVVFLQQVRDT